MDGTRALTFDVPYTLLEPPTTGPHTLVMALHGMGQYPALMQRMLQPCLDLPCLWLFPRAPWPYEIRKPDKIVIGHAWYLYDGDQQSLRASMDTAGAHLLGLQAEIALRHNIRQTILAGFSQGGYLAGYLGPRHPQVFSAAACIAGRIKHEFHAGATTPALGVKLAQFHGGRDPAVTAQAARDAVAATRALGFTDVRYTEDPEAGHEISPAMGQSLRQWFQELL